VDRLPAVNWVKERVPELSKSTFDSIFLIKVFLIGSWSPFSARKVNVYSNSSVLIIPVISLSITSKASTIG
jgi:hypothetical protein